jgi:endonuclease-3
MKTNNPKTDPRAKTNMQSKTSLLAQTSPRAKSSFQARKALAHKEYELLGAAYPNAKISLTFNTALDLLVATVLSAQTTDVQVNKVTPYLFEKYKTASDYASASEQDIQTIIRSIGFYRVKAKHLIGIGQKLLENYDSQVPQTLPELITLPGVGRKTANVVLGNFFGIPSITVDTHIQRISRRLAWTKEREPQKIELDLQKLFEPEIWTRLCHTLIAHGRVCCRARKPHCDICPVSGICPKVGV